MACNGKCTGDPLSMKLSNIRSEWFLEECFETSAAARLRLDIVTDFEGCSDLL